MDTKTFIKKAETNNTSTKKKNGRPNHQGWEIYKFKMVKHPITNKASAICMVCEKPQRNTSITRLASHRKVCGTSSDNKTKLENFEECNNIEYEFADEPSQPESVELPTVFEIVNEDIKRHLKNPLSTKVKVDTQRELDTALSSFLISCNMSFSMVDNKHFRNFVRTLNSEYKLPTSSKLKSETIVKIQQSSESNKRQRIEYTYSDDDELI